MNDSSAIDGNNKKLQITQLLEKYVFYWKWFLLSLSLCSLLGFLYIRYADKVYFTQAIILLEDEKKASGDMAGLGELAMVARVSSSSAAFVNDQVQVLNSRRIMRKVVSENRLNIFYYHLGKIKEVAVSEDLSPIKMILLEPNHPRIDSIIYDFTLTEENNKLLLKDQFSRVIPITLGTKMNSPIGPILFVKNSTKKLSSGIRVIVVPEEFAVNALRNQVSVVSNEKMQSFAISISMKSTSQGTGERVVNALIDQYNKDVTFDKLQTARSTSAFINSRLELIAKDLEAADSKVASFKNSNNLADIQRQSQNFIETASDYEKELVEKRTQYVLAEMLQESASQDNDNLLPSNIGLADPTISNYVKAYNDLVLEKSDLLKSSTADHPLIASLNKNLDQVKAMLTKSLENYRKSIQLEQDVLRGQQQKYQGKLLTVPNQERGFNDIIRQQKIVESIYLFLLQKREENEINASALPANLKIVDDAYTYPQPISPRRVYIIVVVIVSGLLIPLSVLYIKFLFDNKVHSKEDLINALDAPILAEIPRAEENIIKDNSRSSLAESLRILRTNMVYMLGQQENACKVIYVTSTTSGEGKSFIATNLAKIIELSEKKVLLIGADIRSPKVLDYLGLSHLKHTQKGITQFLVDPSLDIRSIILKKPNPYHFDILYSGYIAPNPAELLMNGNFARIIEYGRKHYDFVIVDTAPISLVTDTALIAEYADLTMFVVRAEYLDKRMLVFARDMYSESKLKNMSLVLNDVNFQKGYGYGYGYGYGEGLDNSKNSWFSRFFKKDKS